MAGAKETTRQKMISMMYLVLTAMLALQVDSAIINKFILINESLQNSNAKVSTNNDELLKSMVKTVADPQKAATLPPNAKQLLAQAEEVKTKSAEIFTYLQGVKDELEKKSGKGVSPRKPDGTYLDPNAQSEVEAYMVGAEGAKSGEGYKLRDKLNTYGTYMQTILAYKEPIRMALDAKDMNETKKDESQKNKDFTELNFGQTPMVAALATISQLQSEVKRYEADALKQINEKLGKVEITPDKIQVGMSAKSQYVAAGTTYEAKMFLAAGFSNAQQVMTYNGANVPVEGGQGTVKFKAQGGAYNAEGIMKTSWKGTIKFKTTSGRDTTFAQTFEYFVVRPTVQYNSASVNALYLGCANDLSVQVPAMGADYDPIFNAGNAQVIKGPQRGFITVVPQSVNDVTLNTSSGGALLDSKKFPVRLVPKPTVTVLSGAAPINQRGGVAAPGPALLQATAAADESFNLPRDNKFSVTSWTVALTRGQKTIAQQSFTGQIANIGNLKNQARPGDVLLIQVNEVGRLNFSGAIVRGKPAGNAFYQLRLY
ncbi:MAG: gliding motility protein GldM [Verrucomicrobia bacterium]|nr:gliding motility protein GldM [Cytophagales bacterium]